MTEEYKPVLCYVSEPWAYFTTQKLHKQRGDDWYDIPYEHNAGTPCEPCWHNEPEHVAKQGKLCDWSICKREWTEDGQPRWRIVRVAYDGPLATPRDGHFNSPYSVDGINRGQEPWLRCPERNVFIMAGTTLDAFRRLVVEAGGHVYERRDQC